jgi:protein-S-isoprenylcysteine O-methyltransferase Ste14
METTFKILFLAMFGGVLGAGIRAGRELRRRPGGKVNQVENELPSLKVLRPVLALFFYGGVLDWLLPGTRLGWATLPLPLAVRWLGALAALASVPILWWSFGTLGPNYRGGVGLWDDHRLVTDGPYRHVRHPIYAAFVLAMLGAFGLSANWLVGISGVALTMSIPLLRLSTEERELEERFGSAFAAYRARTPRFLPRPWPRGGDGAVGGRRRSVRNRERPPR